MNSGINAKHADDFEVEKMYRNLKISLGGNYSYRERGGFHSTQIQLIRMQLMPEFKL